MEQLTKENGALKNQNKQLKEYIDDRNARVSTHDKDINNLEQYSRRNSIRIYGLHDEDKEESSTKTMDLVINMVKNKLELPISRQDIDTAHRLGPFKSDANRPVICKFLSRETKHRVVHARKKLKGSAVVVREDLTQKNAKLLETVSRKEEVRNAWSDEGRIIALLQNGRKIKVDIDTNLNRLSAI